MVQIGPAGFPHLSIEELAFGAGGLLPDAILHVCRLRLCASLLCGGEEAIATLLVREHAVAGDNSWFACLTEALKWLEDSIGCSAETRELRGLAPFDFMNQHVALSKFLKRSIKKAQKTHQELLQAWIDHGKTDQVQRKILVEHGWSGPSQTQPSVSKYRCPECGKAFEGEAHLATHRQRAHNVLVAARRFAISTSCQACGRDHFTRPRLIRHLQYSSKKCLPWCLKHGRALTEDEARELDIQDAGNTLKEKHSGIRSTASRLPVLHRGRISLCEGAAEEVVPMVKPVLCGHECVPKWCLDFLRGWHEVDGQWTTSTEHWTRFMIELVETLCHTETSYLDSFKGRIYDLVEEVTWREEDNFEVVTQVLEQLYQILKDYTVVQPRQDPPGPIFPQDRIRQWTTRDHTWRNGERAAPSSCVQARLSQAEKELSAQEFQWEPPVDQTPRVQIAEACYFLVLFSGHRREGDIASFIHQIPSKRRRCIHPICMDLCLDTTWCNLLDPQTQDLVSSYLYRTSSWTTRKSALRNLYRCKVDGSSPWYGETTSLKVLGQTLGHGAAMSGRGPTV